MFEDFYDRISEGMAEADSWFHEGLGWNMAPIIFMDNRTLLCKWYCDIDFTPQGFCTELFKCCTNYEEQKSIKPNKICISQKDLKEFGIFIPITVEKIFISICEPEDEEEPCSFDIGNNARLEKEVFNLELEFDSIGSDWPIQLLNTELPRDEKDEELYEDDDKDSDFDFPDDEDNEDEFAEYYDECEDQSDMPHEKDCEEYFTNNPADLDYITFIRKYKNWVEEIKSYCEIFKQKYDVYPNILVMNRITHGRCDDAYVKYLRGSMEEGSEEDYRMRVELGLDYNDGFYEDLYPDDVSESYFHTKDYKLRMMENSSFGSGVVQLVCVHGFLGNEESPEYKTLSMARNKEKSPHHVIDMEASGKLIEQAMKEEGVTPKLFARIMGWEKPQAVYKWYHGETLPSIDTLVVLSRILNRPMEALLVTKKVGE